MSVPGMTPRATSGSSSAAAGGAGFGRLAGIAGRVWKLLGQQAIAFGALRIAVVCLVAWGVFAHERAMLGDEGERDATALVQTAERVASRSLVDLDDALLRLAGRAERDGAAVDWRSLADQGSALIGERTQGCQAPLRGRRQGGGKAGSFLAGFNQHCPGPPTSDRSARTGT